MSSTARKNSCCTRSGGKDVGFVGNGDTLTFNNINVTATGSYNLTIYYVDGDSGRTGFMSVNGGPDSAISFAQTGQWGGTPGSITLTVNLNAGNNTIKFYNDSAYAPDFDRITLPPQLTTYEAEASTNTLSGGAVIASCSTCSGGQKVGYVGNGGTLTFNNINVSSAGSYTLFIYYCDGDSGRTADMSVNGGAATAINFPGTGGWNTAAPYKITVNLNAGNNTIKFYNNSAYAPDIDRIVM